MSTTPTWGSFGSAPQAAVRLGVFVDTHLGPDVGIAWSAQGALVPLRRPMLDADRSGTIVVVEWHDAIAARPVPIGLGQRIKQWFMDAMTAYGEAKSQEGQAQMAMG